jgi:hypothetical protein
MPDKRPSVKNERQYEALKDKGCPRSERRGSPTPRECRAAVARSPVREGTPSKGWTTAQKKAAGRKGQGLSAEKAIEVERLVRQPSRIRSALSRSCGYAEAGAGPTYSEPARSGRLPTGRGTAE